MNLLLKAFFCSFHLGIGTHSHLKVTAMVGGDIRSERDDLALGILLSDGARSVDTIRSFVGTRLLFPCITTNTTFAAVNLILMLRTNECK